MNLKHLLITFVVVYVLASIPAIFGSGYVIDWVQEATLFQRFKGYVIDGLFNNFVIKTIISIIVGLLINLVFLKRKQK